MTHANIGWWEADLAAEQYTYSEYISDLLGLSPDGIISFAEFNDLILKHDHPFGALNSFDVPEVAYLLKNGEGPVWMRSKICFRETGEEGNTKIYGIAELLDSPNMSLIYQALGHNERILYNILPVGLELYNKEGKLIDVNDKDLEMFHVARREDIFGINLFDNPIFPSEMKEKLLKKENADFTFRYDFSKIGDYYTSAKKKGTIDLMTKVAILFDKDCNTVNYLLINADKTETTVAYNRIHEFETLFELVGDYSKVGYAYLNLLTGNGHASKSWYRNLGESEKTPLTKIIGTYANMHPEDRSVINDFIEKARTGNADKLRREVRVLRENGEYSWTYVNLLVETYAPEDNKLEIIAINYDITDLKETERKLIRARDKAEEADRLKSAFLDNMTHEIRTPLNAIMGFSSLLRESDDPAEKELYCAELSRNNQILLKLINDILDISRIESESFEFHPDWFNLSELIRECTTEHEMAPGVELRIRNAGSDIMAELDRMRIKQLLNNLISNARKNTVQGQVEIAYEAAGQGVRISVADTGSGIPSDKLETIFERFEKLDPFIQGAGLGLSICKSIVEKMEGKIGVDSETGKGSTFWVELPCRTAPAGKSANL